MHDSAAIEDNRPEDEEPMQGVEVSLEEEPHRSFVQQQEELKRLKKEIVTWKTRVSTISQKASLDQKSLKEKIDQLESLYTNAKLENEELKSENKELNISKLEMEGMREALREKEHALKAATDKLVQEQNSSREEIDRLKHSCEEVALVNEKLRADIDAKYSDLREMEKVRSQNQRYRDDLEWQKQELEDQGEQLSDTQSLNRDLQDTLFETNRKNKKLTRSLEEKSRAIASSESKITTLQSEINEKKTTLARLRCETRQNSQTISSLQKIAQNKEQSITSLRSQLETSKKEVLLARSEQATINGLKRELTAYRDAEARHSDELEDAKARMNEAIKNKQNLLQMLESPVVKRRDPSKEDSFPNGEQIEQKFLECHEHAKEFFDDLAYQRSRNPVVEDYQGILEYVFMPCADYALEQADTLVCKKRDQLGSFLEDGSDPLQHPNKLVNLMAMSNMQRIAQRNASVPPEAVLGKKYEELNDWISFSCSEKVESELDDSCLSKYMKGLFDLHLFCRFSEPQCHMWPYVGKTVEFSRAEHDQVLNATFRAKAKPGEQVTVLYPGLYKSDPKSKSSRSQAIVKAVVVLFDRTSESRSVLSLLTGR